jgi:GTP-binding protein
MEIHSAEFISSATHYKDCPQNPFPEYAFMGRSNVGKSSLINMLTRHSKLAKTSSTPGKTQLINHFLINQSWYLADLPGFGFAKVSKKTKEKWDKMIRDYLIKRENLICSFLLIDSRLEPQKIDLENLQFFGEKGLPFAIVFTKADKLSSTVLQSNIARYKKKLSELWDPLPTIFISSSEKNAGREEILEFIHVHNKRSKIKD